MSDLARGTLGVLIPCRNEAAVIERKLANLARLQWPASGRPHRVLVVDDESEDGTFERANELVERLFRGVEVEARCVRNAVRPGKNGALIQGLGELERAVELVVVTDADVVLDEWALVNLARAFDDDARLGMACGAQRFVRALRDDGRIEAPDGGAPEVASTRWDRLTSAVRALESRGGRLFSVHGQLLAWRAALALRPSTGVAADDLDLMLTLRERHPALRVRRIASALFYERKTPPGEAAEAQALRRARAYLQVFAAHPEPPPGIVAGLQWRLYRIAPHLVVSSFPLELLFALVLGLLTAAAWLERPRRWWADVLLLLLVIGVIVPRVVAHGRAWRRLARTIAQAAEAETKTAMPERWEMRRS